MSEKFLFLGSLESLEKQTSERLAAYAAWEDSLKKAANKVFELVVNYPSDNPKLVIDVDQISGKVRVRNPEGEAIDAAIAEFLNHKTIGYFVDLILTNHTSAQQAAKAIKRHAENHAMKSEVFKWLDDNMQNFTSMDKAAEAIAGKLQPIAFRTARDWVSDWKKLRSTGTP